jgi:hypothetical protein
MSKEVQPFAVFLFLLKKKKTKYKSGLKKYFFYFDLRRQNRLNALQT